MQDIAIQRAQELSAEARRAVERVLGRPLHEDEEVSIMALAPHQAPEGGDRQALARKIEQRIKKTARRTKDLPDDRLEEAINEAIAHVRSHPR